MKKIFSLFLISLIVQHVWSQSGEGYNPENPADPDVYYVLTLEASPRSGGTVGTYNQLKLSVGQSSYVYATPRLGYEFKCWMMGDSVVSNSSSFEFTMPEKDVVLTAYFNWNPTYDPDDPEDPDAEGYSHKVSVYSNPSVGGYFNSSNFTLIEGEMTHIYAYPRAGYRFESWSCNGEVVSTDNPLNIRMVTNDMAYTANFVYNPFSPDEPSPNVFNAATGEVIIDHFTPGSLNNAIYTAVGSSDNYSLVQSITVIGRMQSSDFGFARSYRNCSLIDLSRTTGYTEVPSWSFEGAEALAKLILPASVERIGNNVFSGCKNLSELYSYATMPPEVSDNSFLGIESALVIKVPASAVSLYQKANGWKNFTILPVDEETCSMVVNLPADAGDGRYKNMYIELQNAISLQTYKYLITDRTSYTFGNLIRNTSYNIYVKNAAGAVLGEKEKVMLGEEDVTVTFDALRQPQILTAKVLMPDGTDVTSQTSITWLNVDGSLLGNGSKVIGVLEGTNVTYRIVLPQTLAMQYRMPTDAAYSVKSSNNDITCHLQAFQEIALSGRILDVTTEQPISGATITVSQLLNGKYTNSLTARSGGDGLFAINVFNEQSSMTVSANNYLSQTKDYSDFNNSQQIGDIMLKAITGAVISVNFTYTESVEAGQTAETQNWYSDRQNIAYKIVNQTQSKPITEFNVQNGCIVLLEEVTEGDILSITAISKTGMFKDVVAQTEIDSRNRADVTFPLVELGGLKVTFSESDNNGVVGILYDGNGVLKSKTLYNGATLTINNLADGSYTLVTMGSSKFFNSVLNLSELSNAGLTEGRDYVSNSISITSGVITALNIASVPTFDESQFYYTGENTSFSANKSQVTIGSYITLRAKVDFKDEYATSVCNLKLVVDLPESCSFVENSVLTGNGMGGYEVAGNRILINIHEPNELVRFCVIPTKGGQFKPNAFIEFYYGEKIILQPIGAVEINAENLSINVPATTIQEVVKISGTALGQSKINLYDNGSLVGETVSFANGNWEISYDVCGGKNYSAHKLYATAQLENGMILSTDVKDIVYKKKSMYVKNVTMVNGSNTVLFDFENKPQNTVSYSFNPSNSNFTFLVDFVNNEDPLLDNVEVNVVTTNNQTVDLPAYYSASKKKWLATSDIFASNSLPANVTVTYDYVDLSLINDSAVYSDYLISTFEKVELVDIDNLYDNYSRYLFVDHFTEDTTYLSVYKCSLSEIEEVESFFSDGTWSYEKLGKNNSYYLNENGNWAYLTNIADSIYLVGLYAIGKETDDRTYKKTSARRVIRLNWEGGLEPGIRNNYWHERWDDFIQDRYGDILDMADCKLTCQALFGSDQYSALFDATKELLALQAYKLVPFMAYLGNMVGNIGPTAGVGEAAVQLVQGTHATMEQRRQQEILQNFMEQERGYIKTIMDTPDYCKCDQPANANRAPSRNMASLLVEQRKCRKGKKEEKSKNEVTPTIDPSGYVYEGVSSNRLQGVTATAYYMETTEDMYGVLHDEPKVWDAEEYAQENPLFTDENGMYQWDVPQGLWQVKFEKEGYETTYSEWLPVPPPQLEVNIGMVQARQPEVKCAHAYADGVEVEFDKYMIPELLNTDNIRVTQNGTYVEGNLKLMNEETAYTDEGVTYASKVRFVPATPFSAHEVTLYVNNHVKSYANVPMADNYSQTFDIEKEVKEIVVDSVTNVPYTGKKEVSVYVLPADAGAGKKMRAVSSAELIASLDKTEVIIDENGLAQFTVSGELPGATGISFSIESLDVSATTTAKVEMEEEVNPTTVPMPTASIAAGSSVYRGTEVILTAANDEQKIWYTTDGTCPCDENGTRQVYSTPIAITGDMVIKAMAETTEGDGSDVATFTYSILRNNDGIALNNGWTWASFNMGSDALANVNTALASGTWTTNDEIKDDRYTDSYSANQRKWIGTLSKHGKLDNTGMFKIHSSTAQTLRLTGEAINPQEVSITVKPNWNYIGYLPMKNMSVAEALAGYNAQVGDIIKSQDAFAVYSANNGWQGDLTTMNVGKGYMLKRNATSQTSFKYPGTQGTRANVKARSTKTYQYANNMNVIGQITGVELQGGDSLLAVVNGEQRGASAVKKGGRVFLTVQGDATENVELVLQRDGDMIAVANAPIRYENNDVLGTLDAPTDIQFITSSRKPNGISVTPCIVENQMTVEVNRSDVQSVVVSIYNMNGGLVTEARQSGISDGRFEKTFNLSSLSTGVYLVTVYVNGQSNVVRILKK